MRWVLIRHGSTQGNLEGRYIGSRTDEPLCPEGRAALRERTYPPVARVYISPMRRCAESAAIIYPEHKPVIVDALRECDFGAFEGMNYTELNGRPDYQAWIDSGGILPFPDGESQRTFAARCAEAFSVLFTREKRGDCAVVAHGGTIMAIMARYARPHGDYFDFQVRCGEGFILSEDGSYEPLTGLPPLKTN